MGKLRTGRWLLLGLAALAAGCSREDTERLARVGRRIVARTEALTSDLRENLTSGWQGFCASCEQTGLDARVAARLRWDKGLAEAAIRVEAAGGTVELKGTVRDAGQRQRAVEVAESTAGVEKVTDSLHIAER
jgi:hypothetical protein